MKIFFVPKEDITAFELAMIFADTSLGSNSLSPKYGVECDQSTFDKLDPCIKRHFTTENPWKDMPGLSE